MVELKPCPFCEEEEQRNGSGRVFFKELPHDSRYLTTLDDAHLNLAYDKNSGYVLHFEDESGDRMFDVKVGFCPVCGKRMVVNDG